jgi:hypothetical protein
VGANVVGNKVVGGCVVAVKMAQFSPFCYKKKVK